MKTWTMIIHSSLKIVLSILICILISACNNSTKFTPLAPNSIILAFGDSLTAGYGTTPENSYPSVLAQLSGHPVINAGISGETTEQGLARFGTTLDEVQPQLVILMEGANDILQNKSQQQAKQNLAAMIHAAQARKIQILLVAVPAKSLFLASANFYPELAAENKLVLDNTTIAKLLKAPELKSDYVHFNQQGYHLMAERFYALLKEHGALN
jgi:acyl-CoA thioesterase-1